MLLSFATVSLSFCSLVCNNPSTIDLWNRLLVSAVNAATIDALTN